MVVFLAFRQKDSLSLRSWPPFTGVLRGQGPKVPHGVLFEQFWAPASECPKECFLGAFGHFKAQKMPKSTQKALLEALRGRCPKLPKKHSVGHFQARAPEHSCKWRPGSQVSLSLSLSLSLAASVDVCFPRYVLLPSTMKSRLAWRHSARG